MKNGFTLMESLISLLIVSLVMHVLLISVTNYQTIYSQHHNSKNIEWLQFLVLLEKELSYYTDIYAENDQLKMTKIEDENTMFLRLSSNQIYITPGYQPLLFEVQDWSIQTSEDILFIDLVFTNNAYYSGQVEINGMLR
ncbi:prepilin-type N-terminal cleavage/methylation domain-containing protein [Aerococcaceae bacterium DSM 111022]|nr:prepilin-type N-terminal cleavage/methylation domain-containing protein [Aerococcaceae bacterium DSM 111022]